MKFKVGGEVTFMVEQPLKMTGDSPGALSEAQLAQLKALAGRNPDTADIPEAPEDNWRRARQFYKPRKDPITQEQPLKIGQTVQFMNEFGVYENGVITEVPFTNGHYVIERT